MGLEDNKQSMEIENRNEKILTNESKVLKMAKKPRLLKV